MGETTLEPQIVDLELELTASPDSVWDAISDPAHLSSWFAPQVQQSGASAGAAVSLVWPEGIEWQTHIAFWREKRHVRWQDAEEPQAPQQIVTDFFIQPDDEGCRLRVVQSGFAQTPETDELLEAVAAGWDYYLIHLRHYLTHHFGVPRQMVYARSQFQGGRSEIWRNILDSDTGLVLADAVGLTVGDELNLTFNDRSPLEGVVESIVPERTLGIRLPELNEALLLVEIETGLLDCQCGFWLSLYDWEQPQDFAELLRHKVDSLSLAIEQQEG